MFPVFYHWWSAIFKITSTFFQSQQVTSCQMLSRLWRHVSAANGAICIPPEQKLGCTLTNHRERNWIVPTWTDRSNRQPIGWLGKQFVCLWNSSEEHQHCIFHKMSQNDHFRDLLARVVESASEIYDPSHINDTSRIARLLATEWKWFLERFESI